MKEIETLKELMAIEVGRVDDAIKEDLSDLAKEHDPLLDEVLNYALLDGGKRVRPLLVLLASRYCGCKDDNVLKLAIAFEYLHVASLIHDDVIDQADTRRGKPSVVKKFGMISAILSGDYLLARAMTLVGELAGQKGLKIFCDAAQGMVDGEFVQLRNNEQYGLSEEKYFDAIQGKTGLLISAACEIGCLYANSTRDEQNAFRQYGTNIGGAFQVVDDLLDYLGDSAKTGKALGNDLVEGKVTLPLILALQKADSADKEKLLNILESGESRENSFDQVVRLVDKNDGFSDSRQKAEDLINDAVYLIARLECKDEEARLGLVGLAHYILQRNK